MHNGILRLALVFILAFAPGGCVTRLAVDPAKPDDPAQTRQREQLVGTWYGESRTKDGGKRLEIVQRGADGKYKVRFRAIKPSGHAWDQTEVGTWGVSGPVYFTVTKGWLHGKTLEEANPADASLNDAYRILELTSTRFRYRSLQSADEYSESKVPASFDFPAR